MNLDLFDVNTIKPLLSKHGFHFSKALGQNFLTAPWVTEKMVEMASIDKDTGVLEIGPGLGVLTIELAKHAGKVVTLEIDKKLIPLLNETLSDIENVTLINNDILKANLPALVAEHFQGLRPVVCANLPYNITSPILSALIDSKCFEDITVMVQKEVAIRICSTPDGPDYGAFSVYINYHTRPSVLFDVSPNCFTPRPKVTSSVIALKSMESPDFVQDEKLFFRVVRASFAQRRKTLVNALFSVFGNEIDKATLTEIIKDCGFDERIRGEKLGIHEFAKISNGIGKHII